MRCSCRTVVLRQSERERSQLQLSGQSYTLVDWEGAEVLPGLVDSHLHLSMHGMKLGMLDFSATSSKEEMLLQVRQRAELTPPGEWIVGLNWNENLFQGGQAPSRQELDEVTERHPVFLTRTCFHTYLANSGAFHRAGITDSTPDPASGAYGRDQSGELNGWIYEEAGALFHAAQPQPSYEEKKAAI